MQQTGLKSQLVARVLELLREVEKTGRELIVTDRGQPVGKIDRYVPEPEVALRELRGTVLRYDDPTKPVGVEDWEVLR